MVPEIYQRAITEADWMSNVIRVAREYGWRVFHPMLSARSEPGYPDLTLVRERIIFIELKREGKLLTPAQREWADALRAAGQEVYAPAWPSQAEQLYAALVMRRSDG